MRPDTSVERELLGWARAGWLIAGIALLVVVSVPQWNIVRMLVWFATDPMSSDLLSLSLLGAAAALAVRGLLSEGGRGVSVDVRNPCSLYGGFYLLYYLLPYLMLFASGEMTDSRQLEIALLLLVGYGAWFFGTRFGGGGKAPVRLVTGSGGEDRLFLLLCIAGVVIVAEATLWRIQNGIFFNQARFYEQELTVAASFRDVFAQQVQLPLILFLGLCGTASTPGVARSARRFVLFYGACTFLLLVLSSQTRPAVTSLILLLVAIGMFRPTGVRKRQLLAVGLAGAVAVLAIQGVRIAESEDFASAENQFDYAVRNLLPGAVTGLSGSGAEVEERLKSRAGGGLVFLSDVMDKVEERGEALKGQGVIFSSFSLIPRFVWPDKPEVLSPQIVVEILLGMPLQDAPYGPITQFYAEGGWPGVVALYFALGWVVAVLTRRATATGGAVHWIVLALVWGNLVRVEQEVVLGLLGALRSALLVGVLYWAARAVVCPAPFRAFVTTGGAASVAFRREGCR